VKKKSLKEINKRNGFGGAMLGLRKMLSEKDVLRFTVVIHG